LLFLKKISLLGANLSKNFYRKPFRRTNLNNLNLTLSPLPLYILNLLNAKPVPLNRAAKVIKVFIPASAQHKKITFYYFFFIPPQKTSAPTKQPKNPAKAGANITLPNPNNQIFIEVFLR
jgi:hypothetical protein